MEKTLRIRYIVLLQFLLLTVVLWFLFDWSKDYFRLFFLSALEFRIAIVAGLRDHFSLVEVFITSFLGGMFLALLLGFALPIIEYLFLKIPYLKKIWTQSMEKKRKKHSEKMEKLGELMIFFFVAVPLPGTGPLAGMILSEIFKIPYLRALFLVAVGYIVSIIATLSLTASGFKLWEMLML